MTYRQGYAEPPPTLVSAFGIGRYGGWAPSGHSNSPTSGVWPTANILIYMPIFVPTRVLATKMWWANGSAVAGNVGGGIYADAGNQPGKQLAQIASTAQANTLQVQVAALDASVVMVPGIYWLALVISSGTATILRVGATGMHDAFWSLVETSVTPGSLPASATPAEPATTIDYYVFGVVTDVTSIY